MKFLDNYQNHTYALFRIVSGFLFIWHGTQKFFNFPVEFTFGDLQPMLAAAGVIEIVAGTLIMIGLFTRPAAFLASGTMAVAYWMVHATQGLFLFPIGNGGELSVMFCFAFLFIAARGVGMWGVDKT